MNEITVNTEWHEDAKAWIATSNDIWGLAAQAPDLEQLKTKVLAMIADLVELNRVNIQGTDIPVHFVSRTTDMLHLRPVA